MFINGLTVVGKTAISIFASLEGLFIQHQEIKEIVDSFNASSLIQTL